MANHNAGDHRYSPNHQVVSKDGEWLGTVSLPQRFEILDIGYDRILGIERDSHDVEAVSVYRIDR
jgi:hypothetical protein